MLEIGTCLFLVEPALESLQNFVPVETLVPVAALQHLEHSLVLVIAEAEKEQPFTNRDCKTQTRKPKPGFRYQTRNPGLKSKPKSGFQFPKKWRKTSLSTLHFYRKLYYMKKLLSFCGQMQTRPSNQHTFAVFMYCAVTFDYLLR